MEYFKFFLILLTTITFHELGHLIMALLCGIKVDTFSIGLFKPYIHKKIKGIDFRLTPFLIGGYCGLGGETTKNLKNGFLAQPYRKKFLTLIAGVSINLIIACLCFLFIFGDIGTGLASSWLFIKGCFIKDYFLMAVALIGVSNYYIFLLGVVNLFSGITNLIPIPMLDGGHIVLLPLEKILKKNFTKFYNIINIIGFYFLIIIQAIIIYWYWFK